MNLNNVTLVSTCGDERFLDGIISAAQICMKHIKFGAVKILTNCIKQVDNMNIIKISPLNQEEYAIFCLYDLPNYIDTDFCLTFQGDGFIINPHLWKEEFLNYDYIGAPWSNESNNNVGNGGFSLRSQKFLQSAKTLDYNSKIQFQPHIPAGKLITPEDWFACNYKYKEMNDMGIKFANVDTAYKFSVEHPSFRKFYNRNDLETYNSFGFHGSFNTAAMKLLEI